MSIKITIPQPDIVTVTKQEPIVGYYKETERERTLVKSKRMFTNPLFILLIPIGLVTLLTLIFSPKALCYMVIFSIVVVVTTYPVMLVDFGRAHLGNIVLAKINNFDDRWNLGLGGNAINFRLFASLRKEHSTHLGYDILENGEAIGHEIEYTKNGIFLVSTRYVPAESTPTVDAPVDRREWLGRDR